MNTLSKTGRKVICNIIGIKDNESIFIKNKDAFIDRMTLYRVMYNVDKYIDIYKKELSKFKNEKEYIKFIKDSVYKVNKSICTECITADLLISLIISGSDISNELLTNPIKIKSELKSDYKLRCYFDSPNYEGLKFLTNYSIDLESTYSEYIMRVTGCELLASLDDLPLSIISDVVVKQKIKKASLDLGLSMVSLLCPMFLNKNEIYYIGESEIKFISSGNKSVESLDRIYKAFTEDSLNKYGIDYSNINIEVYKEKRKAFDRNIVIKENIAGGNSRGVYDIINYDTLGLVRYLRKLYNEPIGKYDNYFEYKGIEAKLSRDFDIQWINS